MFKNVGKKIQSVSEILVLIGVIGGILIFMVGFLNLIDGYSYNQAEATVSMISGASLAIGSYLTSLFLFAFGKIVDNIGSISEELTVIRESLNNQNAGFKTDKDNLPEI